MCTYYVAMMPSSKKSHFMDADESWRVCSHATVITRAPVTWSLKRSGSTSGGDIDYVSTYHSSAAARTHITGHRVVTIAKYDLPVKCLCEACSESIKQANPSSLYL